jgi:transcriptional regulator of NAD metabolism
MVLFMDNTLNTETALAKIRARKEQARRDSKIILADGTKVVNGVKLHPVYNNEGNLVYVSIPQ